MINFNIKPRLARLESGAIVEHRYTGNKGFVVEDTITNTYKIAMYQDDGSLILSTVEFLKDDYGEFFTTYKVLAQHNEYHAKIEEI